MKKNLEKNIIRSVVFTPGEKKLYTSFELYKHSYGATFSGCIKDILREKFEKESDVLLLQKEIKLLQKNLSLIDKDMTEMSKFLIAIFVNFFEIFASTFTKEMQEGLLSLQNDDKKHEKVKKLVDIFIDKSRSSDGKNNEDD